MLDACRLAELVCCLLAATGKQHGREQHAESVTVIPSQMTTLSYVLWKCYTKNNTIVSVKQYAVNSTDLAKKGAKIVASAALCEGMPFANIVWSQQIENLHQRRYMDSHTYDFLVNILFAEI